TNDLFAILSAGSEAASVVHIIVRRSFAHAVEIGAQLFLPVLGRHIFCPGRIGCIVTGCQSKKLKKPVDSWTSTPQVPQWKLPERGWILSLAEGAHEPDR